MENVDTATEILAGLKAIGVSVSLDDFAMIGDIMGIRDLVQEFEATMPEFRVFFQRIVVLAKDLKVSELQKTIRQALKSS